MLVSFKFVQRGEGERSTICFFFSSSSARLATFILSPSSSFSCSRPSLRASTHLALVPPVRRPPRPQGGKPQAREWQASPEQTPRLRQTQPQGESSPPAQHPPIGRSVVSCPLVRCCERLARALPSSSPHPLDHPSPRGAFCERIGARSRRGVGRIALPALHALALPDADCGPVVLRSGLHLATPRSNMEKHHKLRRDPSWSPHGCNICGKEGHQAASCPNGTVNWKCAPNLSASRPGHGPEAPGLCCPIKGWDAAHSNRAVMPPLPPPPPGEIKGAASPLLNRRPKP